MHKQQAKALTAKANFSQLKLRQAHKQRGITKREAETRAQQKASDMRGLLALLKLWHF